MWYLPQRMLESRVADEQCQHKKINVRIGVKNIVL